MYSPDAVGRMFGYLLGLCFQRKYNPKRYFNRATTILPGAHKMFRAQRCAFKSRHHSSQMPINAVLPSDVVGRKLCCPFMLCFRRKHNINGYSRRATTIFPEAHKMFRAQHYTLKSGRNNSIFKREKRVHATITQNRRPTQMLFQFLDLNTPEGNIIPMILQQDVPFLGHAEILPARILAPGY